MLSNKDFAELLRSGGVSSENNDGKVRFDLKQISDWDRQNNAKARKKSLGGKTPTRRDSADGEENHGSENAKYGQRPGYRDRAHERRKDLNTEESELEAVVSKLDAEQTKFLGGDIEHTHLVKGLDYALLRKVRDDAQLATKANDKGDTAEDDLKDDKDIKTFSALGIQIKRLLPLLCHNSAVANLQTTKKSGLPITSSGTPASAVVAMFARLAFEFDLNPETDIDLPTAITRSKLEWCADDETKVSCVVSHELQQRLRDIFGPGGRSVISRNAKRKRKEGCLSEQLKPRMSKGEIASIGSAHSTPKAAGPHVKIDGYEEDIFEGLGRYVPVGALNEDEHAHSQPQNENHPTPSVPASEANASTTTKNTVRQIFAELQPNVDAKQEQQENSQKDLLAPVRAALQAQAVRERKQLAEKQGFQQKSAAPLEEECVIHRDVFGAGDMAAEKRGDAMWHGSYDIFPETGDYEMYDSDNGEDSGENKKGSQGDIKAKSSVHKTTATTGPNRAARRAAAAASAGR